MNTLLLLSMLAVCPSDALCQPGMVCVKYVRTNDNRTVTTCMTPEELVVWKQVQRARRALAKQKALEAAKKKVEEPAPVVIAPTPAPVQEPTPVVQTTVVVVPVEKPVIVEVPTAPKKDEESEFFKKRWLVPSLRLGLGLGVRNPNTSGVVGLRVKSVPIHLGVEGFYAFDNIGWGVQGLVYTFDNNVIAHHLDVGILWTQKNLLSTQDVPRARDFIFGTGLEWKFHKNLSLTVDWRVAFPDPHFVATHQHPIHDSSGNQVYGQAGRYLDAKAVVGNAFSQSQVIIGLMGHPW